MKKRLYLSAAALVIVIAAGSYSSYWHNTGRFQQYTDDAYVGGDVTVIAPKVAGFITEVAVTDNESVHAGDLLLKIDDRDYRAQLAYAEGAVASQKAAIDNISAKLTLQQSLIIQAGAELSASQAEVKRAADDESRYIALAKAHAGSQQDLDRAHADRQKADAAQTKSNAAIAAAKDEVGVLETQKIQAQAALLQAEAQRDLAKLNLSYTELRAPVDGVVGNRSARAGAYTAIGTQLISIVPAKGLWVDANFKESQISQMKAGQRVSITADVLPGEKFTGHVVSIAPATGAEFSVLPPENATGNFTKIVQRVPVRVMLDEDTATLGRLRPGLSVSVTVNELQVDALPQPKIQQVAGIH